MSPDAIRYYKKWLTQRYDAKPLYLVIAGVALAYFLAMAIVLHFIVGDWSGIRLGLLGIMIGGPAIILLVAAARIGTSIGGWTLLEQFEAGQRAGHFREVWRALMIKYRGFHPTIIESERFHRLFLAIGTDIVAHEELTLEQAKWMDELLTAARTNLVTPGGVTASKSTARFAGLLIIAGLVFTVLNAVIRLLSR